MYWNFDQKRECQKASNPVIPFYDVFKKDINIPVHHIGASPMYENDCTIESYLKRTPCVVKNSLVEQWIGLSNSVKGTGLKLTAYIRYAWTRDVISYLLSYSIYLFGLSNV